jgi:precorrin-3B methylase
MLQNPAEENNLNELQTSITSTVYPNLLEKIRHDEAVVDEAKKNLSRSKEALEKAMKAGA